METLANLATNSASSNVLPPKHTLILKAVVNPSSKSTVSASSLEPVCERGLRKQLGESQVRVSGEPKLVPPALVVYPTAKFMCTSNDNLLRGARKARDTLLGFWNLSTNSISPFRPSALPQ
ncbi:hypothetical protein THAOC_29880, partial [Thalassiosira oceanica]